MKLTSRQVADKLGITPSAVNLMTRQGKLRDIGANRPGRTRHACAYDSREINEFAKTYRRHGHSNNSRNGHSPLTVAPLPGPVAFASRLDRIEAKLDELLSLWR